MVPNPTQIDDWMLPLSGLVVQTKAISDKTFASTRTKAFNLNGLGGQATHVGLSTIKNLLRMICKGASNSLRNEPKNATPNASPVQAAPGAAAKAEKVRSSRYEWEGRNNEPEKSPKAPNAARKSLLASAKAFLKKLFSGDRKPGSRGFFDNDDDASPSAA